MFKEAILHQADSNMSYVTDDGLVVIILKAKKDDLSEVIMMVDDRYDRSPKLEPIRISLPKVMSDELYDYFRVEFKCPYTRMSYYFSLIDLWGYHVYFYQDGFSDVFSWGRQRMFQLPYLHKQDTPQVPKWLKESVMYQIFPDSFANDVKSIEERPITHTLSNGVTVESRYGGTLRGIIQNIPYLVDLGINLIYLNPVFTANSYHKYDEVDYYHVDPCLGTNDELKELVALCHQNNIKVMLDIVFNQSSSRFFAFQDVLMNQDSSDYKDWYHIRNFPVKTGKEPNYETFGFYDVMPKFNTDNEEVERYLLDIAIFWVKECDVDGYRLDVANEMPHEFWRRFRREIDRLKPDFAFVGEVWHEASSWLGRDQFHSVMNYPLLYAIWEFFGLSSLNAYQFGQTINRLTMSYRVDHIQAMMNFLDSHDVGRFLSIAGTNTDRQKLAAAFLLTYVGMPSIYYGDEKAIEGTDIYDSRRKMIWEDVERSASMYQFYRQIIRIRKENPVLVYGAYQPFIAEAGSNLFGFIRSIGEEQLICLFNNTGNSQELSQKLEAADYKNLLTNETLSFSKGTIVIQRLSAMILKKIN